MRKLLLAATVMTGIAVQSSPANAQLAVHDLAADIGISKETIETIRNGLTQVQQLQTEVQQLQQWVYIGENIIHDPSLGAVMPLLNMAGLNQDLPINPYALMGLTSGMGGPLSFAGLAGKLSLLGSLANTSYTHDHLWNCTDASVACQQSQMNASSIAGTKATGGALFSDLTNHMTILASLRARLLGASDPKTVQDVTAQIALEDTWVNNSAAQLKVADLLQNAQVRQQGQFQEEAMHQDFTATIGSIPN